MNEECARYDDRARGASRRYRTKAGGREGEGEHVALTQSKISPTGLQFENNRERCRLVLAPNGVLETFLPRGGVHDIVIKPT